jgi:hypothetical protein
MPACPRPKKGHGEFAPAAVIGIALAASLLRNEVSGKMAKEPQRPATYRNGDRDSGRSYPQKGMGLSDAYGLVHKALKISWGDKRCICGEK